MDFSDRHTFDAPIDVVWDMFRDPDSHRAKFETMGHREIEVLETEIGEDHAHIVVRQVVDVDLPGFAKKFLKPTNTVTTTDDWRRDADGNCHGTQQIDTAGAPVRISGSTTLSADGEHTNYEIKVRLEVKVPLVGNKIAEWAKGTLSRQLDEEFAAGDTWLASHR